MSLRGCRREQEGTSFSLRHDSIIVRFHSISFLFAACREGRQQSFSTRMDLQKTPISRGGRAHGATRNNSITCGAVSRSWLRFCYLVAFGSIPFYLDRLWCLSLLKADARGLMSRFEHVFSLKYRCAVGILRGGGVMISSVCTTAGCFFGFFTTRGEEHKSPPSLPRQPAASGIVALLAIPMPARIGAVHVFWGSPGDEYLYWVASLVRSS